MEVKTFNSRHIWNVVQEQHCSGSQSISARFFLSALDKGWQIKRYKIVLSRDQKGLIYLVALRNTSSWNEQQMVLPDNLFIDELLSKTKNNSVAPNLLLPCLWYG